jgi:hypothetical protein
MSKRTQTVVVTVEMQRVAVYAEREAACLKVGDEEGFRGWRTLRNAAEREVK